MTYNPPLRNNLVLFEYILKHLGLRSISGVRETLKRQDEGYDAEGRSYFFNALKGYLTIDDYVLEQYDENIKSYLNHINTLRTDKISLKYFQYLAILFAEIFLDNLQNNPQFLEDLNAFVEENDKFSFEESDLTKLAYWMATGSGKTLIMHINYLQYHKYNKKLLDNIILITPSQDMSKQHLDELRKSNIPAKIFDASNPSQELIQILDIHKLTEEKRGQGITVEVSSFEGNNLIFVDEGHKGFSGNKWKNLRDQISKIGFTFEYSATFDEAIGSQRDKLMEEYSKAIIFDYSYRFFYYDGYGKEFKVMNLKESQYSEHKELILLFNLLSYYQQIKFFNEKNDNLKAFSFEKPLWIFIGNTVTGGSSRPQKAIVSDLEFLLNFFNSFLTERDLFESKIDDILNDRVNLLGSEGTLNSDTLFGFIKSKNLDINVLYKDVLRSVFNTNMNQSLELWMLDSSQGEIAIKVSNSDTYFGLIYIGDTNSFKRSIEASDNLTIREDKFSNSLFNTVNDVDSDIKVLLGSKKFIEGWNSYRVSNMGLLNMGSTKGSQIIQLFGRGVRLRGYKKLMKRTQELIYEGILSDSDISSEIEILETLNIFGIKADYVDTFRKQLEKEGIVEEEVITLNIRKNEDFLKKNLYTMKIREDAVFRDPLILEFDDKLSTIRLDLRPRIKSFDSTQDELLSPEIEEITFHLFDYLEFVDWDKIYFDLYDFKQQKGFYNLYFDKKALKYILNEKNFIINIDSTLKSEDISKLYFAESLCVRVLRSYIQNFYNFHKRKWATNNIEYSVLSDEDDNFQDYTFIIDKREQKIIENIQEFIDEANELYENDQTEIPSLVFDKHFYQPLIAENRRFTTIPTGLNEGEVKFIKDLRKFFVDHKEDDGILGYEFFIFRNLSRKGVGIFTETNNFYPDFILWAVNEEHQKIVFIDPKGLIHGVSEKMAKIGLNDILQEIQGILGRDEISLSSFILSTTQFDDLKRTYELTKEQFEDRNVLFQEDPDYIAKLITHIIED